MPLARPWPHWGTRTRDSKPVENWTYDSIVNSSPTLSKIPLPHESNLSPYKYSFKSSQNATGLMTPQIMPYPI